MSTTLALSLAPDGQRCPLMGWPGRAQRLICWTVAGRREANAQGACDAHISEDRSNHHHDRDRPRQGVIILQQKVSRSQLERCLANIPRCLIGMEACSGSHHIGRQLAAVGHGVRLIPAQYVKPFLKGHKNDYRDAEAIAEAVQRPTVHFVAIKTPEQMDLLALHRVRSRLVSQRTGVINQIRGFLIERGVIVRQGVVPLRKALPDILRLADWPALAKNDWPNHRPGAGLASAGRAHCGRVDRDRSAGGAG